MVVCSATNVESCLCRKVPKVWQKVRLRRWGSSVRRLENESCGSINWKFAGDYDAYTMLTLAIDYVSTRGTTWMRQLVGVIFFWMPRAIWKNKPVGSGYFIAEQLGWSFKNLSCPLPGEAYINLGFIGVLLFAILIGKIMRFLDSCYWCRDNEDNRRIDVLYPVIMMLFFFMCRGDLLSSETDIPC